MTDLNLLFPQWQGAGPENTLFYPPGILAGHRPDLVFDTVPVAETADLETENRILGYRHILAQMTAARQLIEARAPDTILTLGGDCGVQMMPVSWLNRIHRGNLTLVWLDAHADLNTPRTSPSGCFHGMPLAHLLGLGDPQICRTAFSRIDPGQIIMAGLRNPDPEEERLIEDKGITRIDDPALMSDPDTLVRAVRDKGCNTVYVHIDLDVLDPQVFPWVGWPESGGLDQETLLELLKTLGRECRMIGLGLTEFTVSGNEKRGLDFLKNLVRTFRTQETASGR